LNVAPLNTPLRNRLQTVGVIWHTISIPSFVCLFLLFVSLGWISWLTVVFPYFVWWYGFDLHTPTNGKVVYRVRDWMRNFIIWEWFVNYFPIVVHKTVDLEPTFSEVEVVEDDETDDEEDLISEDSRTLIDKIFKGRVSTGPRYIFGYHPHGVISMGVMGTFATNAVRNEPYQPPLKILKPFFHDPSQGERIFAGIGNIFPLTLTTQFTLPFYRDYLLGLGLTSASAKNIKSLINNGDNSVCIVVGGAQESLLNNMVSESKRQIKLVLHKRKGFVKLAIELGNVSLVPIFAFGEADIYKLTIPEPGSLGYAFQQWMKKTFSFTVPFFSARGVFIYDFGFLPFRNPINVCVGRPIHIPQVKTKMPPELLDHYHKLYVDELKRVYEENKCKYGYEDVELNIIE
ncbi:diacylglycerol acyltransferase, partial [Scheffersomyces stipitis CBS 6054]